MAETFAGCDVVAHTHASLDITDPAAVRQAVEQARPSAIINCAAFNHVDDAETRPADAFAVNAFAVRSLARAAESVGATLVHYGSDFVFDGSASEPYPETAQPSPRSAYALSKLLGEWFALDAPRALVLRVESLFGATRTWSGRAGSVDSVLDALEQGRPARVFSDRVVSPSYAEDVARATKHLLESGAAPGLYHAVNTGYATWYELASEAARLLGVAPRLEPVSVESVRFAAARPRFCAL
ncbi:MAG: hypothetical protein A3F70_14355, partial [Acidobacteria bacterium RIFCSPLOWO2_12_FULL_67_14]